jgi:hypothetical protein
LLVADELFGAQFQTRPSFDLCESRFLPRLRIFCTQPAHATQTAGRIDQAATFGTSLRRPKGFFLAIGLGEDFVVGATAAGDGPNRPATDPRKPGNGPLAERSLGQQALHLDDQGRRDHEDPLSMATAFHGNKKKPAAGNASSDGLVWLLDAQALRIPFAPFVE